jgi:hypothetical protein
MAWVLSFIPMGQSTMANGPMGTRRPKRLGLGWGQTGVSMLGHGYKVENMALENRFMLIIQVLRTYNIIFLWMHYCY